MLDFAMKISLDAKSISDSDFEKLKEHGFSAEGLLGYCSYYCIFLGLVTVMANFTSMRPNSEFYTMGTLAVRGLVIHNVVRYLREYLLG